MARALAGQTRVGRDFKPPPTIQDMSNNFEAKHPRAKDGKFTEKRRAESGLTLGSALVDESYPVSEEDSTPKIKVNNDWVNITYLENYIDSHEGKDLKVTDFAWPGEDSSKFPKDMDYAREFAQTYQYLGPVYYSPFNAYSEEATANGLTPDIDEFYESFQGEYASFDDFAAGYANDLVLDCEDYETMSEFFDYESYKRDTGLGEEEAEELIASGDTETVKRYFDYGAFAKDMEVSYATEDAPGGNVFVFQRN